MASELESPEERRARMITETELFLNGRLSEIPGPVVPDPASGEGVQERFGGTVH